MSKTINFSPEFDEVPKVTYTLKSPCNKSSMSDVKTYRTHVVFTILHNCGDTHTQTLSWAATVD